jgi:hypothetical protein
MVHRSVLALKLLIYGSICEEEGIKARRYITEAV